MKKRRIVKKKQQRRNLSPHSRKSQEFIYLQTSHVPFFQRAISLRYFEILCNEMSISRELWWCGAAGGRWRYAELILNESPIGRTGPLLKMLSALARGYSHNGGCEKGRDPEKRELSNNTYLGLRLYTVKHY